MDAEGDAPTSDGTAHDVGRDAGDAGFDASSTPTLRVLFVGNSYTAVNGLPNVVAELSHEPQSPVVLEVAEHAPGGQTWEGHAADPATLALIRKGWDYVVLQDQSVQPFLVPTGIKSALRSLDAEIKNAGAKTVLYMTWARSADSEGMTSTARFVQDVAVARYYDRHAEAVGAIVAPVGRAWERALRHDLGQPAMVLHDTDGSHPNPRGTYLAACVLYAALTGRSPLGLGAGGLGVGAADIAKLQQVSWQTLRARAKSKPPLLGEWPMGSAPSGNDLVPSTGLPLGNFAGPAGVPSSATHFASGTYAAVPYFTGLNVPQITVAFHAYRDDWTAPVTNAQYMVGKWMGYEVYHDGTSLLARVHTVAEASPAPLLYEAPQLAPGWHHFTLTYDGAAYALWIDKARVAEATTTGALLYSAFVDSDPGGEGGRFSGVAIGGRPVANTGVAALPEPSNAFTGALSDVRLYDRPLTAAEIGSL